MRAGTRETEIIYAAAASLAAVVAAGNDLKSRRIPNALTGTALLCGLGLHLALGGLRAVCLSVLAGLLVGTAFLLFYAAGGMGAGDVKLMAAVGCLAGTSELPVLLMVTVGCGALLAIGIALRHRRLEKTFADTWMLVAHHRQHGLHRHPAVHMDNNAALRMPYAVPIAAGCLAGLGVRIWAS